MEFALVLHVLTVSSSGYPVSQKGVVQGKVQGMIRGVEQLLYREEIKYMLELFTLEKS